MTISGSIHVTTNDIILFFFMTNIVYMYHIFFIRSSMGEHFSCFHVLAIANSATMNIGMPVSFQIMVFCGYMPMSGIAGSYGNSTFSFLRSIHTILPSGYINFFILINPSSYWMKATHVSKDNLLCSVYCFKCCLLLLFSCLVVSDSL